MLLCGGGAKGGGGRGRGKSILLSLSTPPLPMPFLHSKISLEILIAICLSKFIRHNKVCLHSYEIFLTYIHMNGEDIKGRCKYVTPSTLSFEVKIYTMMLTQAQIYFALYFLEILLRTCHLPLS